MPALVIGREWWNVIGLCLGIIGVVLLFIWGPPQPSFEKGVGIVLSAGNVLSDGKTVAEHDRDIDAEKQFTARISRVGLGLILLGFVAQLYGSWPQTRTDSRVNRGQPSDIVPAGENRP
jgi:drug/metabolite transporter (DMT)-like permease